MTDLIGDIVISCTGGITPNTSSGSNLLPTANFTVSLGTNVTSRLLGNSSGSTFFNVGPSNTSEALLLIDEPGSVTTSSAAYLGAANGIGIGGAAPQAFCPNTGVGAGSGGCPQYAVSVPCTGPACTFSPITVMSSSPTTYSAPGNMYFGLVTGNQVTFQGVPILPPSSTGIGRVFRITNVRANVSGLSAGLAGITPLTASVAISGNTSVPVSNPVLTAGFIQAGLNTAVRNVGNTGGLSGSGRTRIQCATNGVSNNNSSSPPNPLAVLQFNENFGTAFKTRVNPNATASPTTAGAGQSSSAVQNVPGTIYNSESGFIVNGVNGGNFTGTNTPGLSDYGTRLKAVFNNIPAGVRLFVSTTNLAGNGATNQPATGQPAGNSASSFALLVVNETSPDSNGAVPVMTATTQVNSSNLSLAEIPIVGGTGTAVWEVINTNPAALETFNFGVYELFPSNVANNSPPPGTGTVNLSFAPTPTAAFSASAGACSSNCAGLPIPRFADTSTASNIITISICQTALIFPFVTNQGGFDTGLAIANTSQDPFGTGTEAGKCTANWYGDKAPAANDFVSGTSTATTVAAGTVAVALTSANAPGFQGYMIAVCNFEFAHGFAFISDLGARNLAMGYLALVTNGAGNRPNATEQLEN